MQVTFRQSVCINGIEFKKGTHEVPKDVLAHKYFHKLIQAGLVSEAEGLKVTPETLEQRNKRLSEKLLKKAVKAAEEQVKAQTEPEEVQEAPADEDFYQTSEPVESDDQSYEEESFIEEPEVKAPKKKPKKKKSKK